MFLTRESGVDRDETIILTRESGVLLSVYRVDETIILAGGTWKSCVDCWMFIALMKPSY